MKRLAQSAVNVSTVPDSVDAHDRAASARIVHQLANCRSYALVNFGGVAAHVALGRAFEKDSVHASPGLSRGQVLVERTVLQWLTACLAEPSDIGGVLDPLEQFLIRLDGDDYRDGFSVSVTI